MKRILLTAGALLVGLAAQASAQTMSLPAGLYVRGDLGGAFSEDTTFTSPSAPAAINGSADNSVIFGGGIGYRWNPVFRTDLTLDYMPSFRENLSSGIGSGAGDLNSFVAMVNAYLDLKGVFPNMFGPFQPFINGGIGLARNDLGTLSGSAFGVGGSVNGSAQTNFAWGIGAGIGYPITPHLTAEVAYKYLDLGELQSGATLQPGATSIVPLKSGDFNVHTVTLGLRYAF